LLNYTDRDQSEQEFPDGVLVDFMNRDMQVTSTLTAKLGIREQDKGLITMRDSVVLRTVDNEVLETEELIWDERTGRAYTDKFVKVTKPGEVMYGFGLEANEDFSYWKILVPKGRIKTDKFDEGLQ
jgi:LPS export ABC transporter protein LptC